ncbi:MAG: ShlB/FhaC/HecB family hemolysin secretion/activation protein, partial [Verrucomicrobiota bacterium]|nr:ShlB/FhaC/HecB family hemolysin secretion/activation protein [Verrucomicrobiota bacterium]
DYRARRQFANRGSLELNASVVGSPGELGGKNSTSDFQNFRAGAEANYLYGRAQAVWTQRLPGAWTLRARGQFQLGSGALLPTEQLSLGGHATVRGFEERGFLSARGYLLSAEVRTPPVTLPTGEHFPVQVQFLGFLDHGGGWRDEITAGREDQESLTSVGAGLRAQIGRHINLRADVGVPLEGDDGPRGHVGLTASF